MENQKSCFVVMGFGLKTDFATGRKLDLDYTYHALIKPVVESKNLLCVRADEIRHAGVIDKVMYEQLFTADIVIADISTANPNACYELGIRHALRPYTTIVISEDHLSYPFDLNHILITKYTHLGLNIDYYEVLRFQKLLGEMLDALLQRSDPDTDSPVYTFYDLLIPPSLRKEADELAQKVNKAVNESKENLANVIAQQNDDAALQTISTLIKQGETALNSEQFVAATTFYNAAYQILKQGCEDQIMSNTAYIIQRLALATFQSKQPDETTALNKAINILAELDLKDTNDPETVALAAKIEKRLFFNTLKSEHLQKAISYAARSYYLLTSRYQAVNLAFLLNARAASDVYDTEQEKIADMVWAKRIRHEVIRMCEEDWITVTQTAHNQQQAILLDDQIKASQEKTLKEQQIWILVNKAEAYFGLSQMENFQQAYDQAKTLDTDGLIIKKFDQQLSKLKPIMAAYEYLLNPPRALIA
ncbi:tetratricopeptide repeat-containing protein [Mucilaginibacter lacusdianchii]|uniref:tetratricopeptide repeat-containing protein n=1 Tax=Mucilaginibacter lacusdianchii TaxID=2684211 RepID=UPI00131DA35A|nr:tetratricopeptide repeat-containing protein [Mucilaginibacter sp. JXJ CY 39]